MSECDRTQEGASCRIHSSSFPEVVRINCSWSEAIRRSPFRHSFRLISLAASREFSRSSSDRARARSRTANSLAGLPRLRAPSNRIRVSVTSSMPAMIRLRTHGLLARVRSPSTISSASSSSIAASPVLPRASRTSANWASRRGSSRRSPIPRATVSVRSSAVTLMASPA